MKARDLITALQRMNPDQEVGVAIGQSNKVWPVVRLDIKYGSGANTDDEDYNEWARVGQWVSNGIITVHLPDGAYIAKLPKDMI